MNVLCVGDIVGRPGREIFERLIKGLKSEYDIEFTIVNAENSASGAGIIPRVADQFFEWGADVLTLGDHVWDKREIMPYLDGNPRILRPANFPEGSPGRGYNVFTTEKGHKIAVINLLGRVFMRYNVNCPFRELENIVLSMRAQTANIIVDIHAEATSEKVALGHFIDGRATVVFGTHTHVQTADDKVLPNGTGYITDLGMTGPYDSVIGQDKQRIIQRFVTSIPNKFEVATEDVQLHGAVFDIDEKTGKTRKVVRIQRK